MNSTLMREGAGGVHGFLGLTTYWASGLSKGFVFSGPGLEAL